MKKRSMFGGVLIVSLLLIFFGVSGGVFPAEGELLTFKPHSPLKYSLNIKTKSDLETNFRTYETKGGVHYDRDDMLTVSQSVKEVDSGLLDIALTVDKINMIPHGAAIGAQLKREQIIGNTQHTMVNVLGSVKKAKGFPHFSSDHYYYMGHDGGPMDMYRVMLMIYPQFPMRLLRAGDQWEVEDEITVVAADVTGEIATIEHDLEHKINRRIKYTLMGFTERKGYQTAHISFEAKYGFDSSMIMAYRGFYSNGSGEDTGEFWFAPKEGFVVDANIKSRLTENKSEDGQTVVHWLDPKTMIFLDLVDGQTTVPLKWRVEKTLSFGLVK